MVDLVKRKPARVQVDPDSIDLDEKPSQTGTIFNIWYLKWAGGDTNDLKLQQHARTRCNVKLDSGYTKADSSNTSTTTPIFCVFFAKGCCCLGKRCERLHRIPNNDDRVPITQDCFGRLKTSDYRDDMDGVGSFNKINTTLYVGRINDINDESIEYKIQKNFKEFGDITKIRVIPSKNIAFITFRNELNAQFAKELMSNQSLDKNNDKEILNIRWANEDPDPEAQRRNKRKLENDTMDQVKNLLNKFDENNKKIKYEPELELELDLEPESEPEQETKEESGKVRSILGNNQGGLEILKKLQSQKQRGQKINTIKLAMEGYSSSSSEDDDE